MAQSNKGKKASPLSTSSKSSTAAKATGNNIARSGQSATKTPRRREIMAAVCFILAAFSFISYFNSDGAFIGLFTSLVRGLVGHGFFYLAPVLLLCAVILTFHRGRPVAFRVGCTLWLCILAGSLTHLFTRSPESGFEVSFSMFPLLWQSGLELQSGGAVAGSLADLFAWLFGSIGATAVLIIATVLLLLAVINRSVVGIVDAIRERQRQVAEYVPEPIPERMSAAESRTAQVQKRVKLPSKGSKAIDIPIDGEEGSAQAVRGKSKRAPLFEPGSEVKTPDQLISEYASDNPEPASPPGTKSSPTDFDPPGLTPSGTPLNAASDFGIEPPANPNEHLPLDIPFMEGRRKPKTADIGPLPTPIVPELDNSSESMQGTEDEIPEDRPNLPPEPAPEPTPKPALEPAIEPAPTRADAHPKSPSPVPQPVINDSSAASGQAYIFPPLELLAQGKATPNTGGDEVRQNSQRLESAFQSFGVNVKISNATRGPAVTRYEAALEAGVKLSKITNLSDDIALSLGTSGVRIAAMQNMASTVGIEVPNKSISTVYLREIIESDAFTTAKSKLTFAIGTNISGESIVGNVSKMPHMLVAGTTGSGKSVSLNSIILSILYKASPTDVKFVMIDPKMVEFKIYNDIPHLHIPVVTDCKKASGALQWAVFEMERRYRLFSETSARELEAYNQIAKNDEEREEMPRIIVVIDELADLMMTAAKEVEESICRVAQKGRAAGMHLIIATQSPRADVITGLMKANIPSRIAFKVSSALESRIILDAGGNADKLVGNGDMLFAPIGSDKPMRVQGTWVSDEEREAVVNFLKNSGETHYSEEVMQEIENMAVDKSSGGEKAKEDTDTSADYDDLLPQAVDLIFETGQASVSMLQRRLKLGFSRAGRIVDQMEQIGVVGPYEGSKPRPLLITKEQWKQMQYINGTAPTDKPEMPTVTATSSATPSPINPLPIIVETED